MKPGAGSRFSIRLKASDTMRISAARKKHFIIMLSVSDANQKSREQSKFFCVARSIKKAEPKPCPSKYDEPELL